MRPATEELTRFLTLLDGMGREISDRVSGRFAVSLVGPPNPAAGAPSPIAKVFASGTEVDGAGNPILGLADVRIYNVVPTLGNVTIRGEVVWNGTINVKINLVWFG